MAALLGPEPACDASLMGNMDPDEATQASIESQPRGGPPPNPPFNFPMQLDSPSSAPSSYSRASGRRPMSAIETGNRSFDLVSDDLDGSGKAALPAFSFNPGASLPPDPHFTLSPPQSPRQGPSQQRPGGHGHRRGGSEFVGGRLRDGNSISILGTSPTKPDAGFSASAFQPPRRGHRRGVSSAISANDIPLLPPPQHNFTLKGSSAPNSPTNFEQLAPMAVAIHGSTHMQPEALPEVDKSAEAIHSQSEGFEDTSYSSVPAKPPTRTRVGFSDTLEFIPRPLSVVSTDTSSTITARPSHSVSDSITSLMSNSPSGRESPAPLSRSSTRDADDSRPSTAGAILDRVSRGAENQPKYAPPRRRNSIPALLDTAEAQTDSMPLPSPTKVKRWSFFGLEPFTNSSSPTRARPLSSGSGDSVTRAISESSSDHGSDSPAETSDTKSAKKRTKRGKVKGWAGSILPLKSKSSNENRAKNEQRPPTPPSSEVPCEDEVEKETPVEINTPQMPTFTITESTTPPRPVPRKYSSDDSALPMIDLDAALGPFNTPLPNNPEWDAAQQAAGNLNRRRLHSAQGMKGFGGPGMHYHRRAESAPALPPFEAGRSSIHRYGSNSTMADVFEEDEDDEVPSQSPGRKTSSQHSKQTEESDGEITPPAGAMAESAPFMRRQSSGLSDRDQSSAHSLRLEHSRTSLQDSIIAEEPSSGRFRDGSISSSPRLAPRRISGSKDLAPVDIGPTHALHPGGTPISPYAMSVASSYPSPRSPISIDAQRISTAPSSINDANSFQSLLMGEPGPELRLSVDYDIPSLTSSNSTMTRESNTVPFARSSQPTLREPRPLSVSSAAFSRRRSSLASISRLISSSHGERSKLSTEVTLAPETENKKLRSSRSSRLSRLVQFWKPGKEESTK